MNLELSGELPRFYEIAEYLWGKGADFDSDGNSVTPDSQERSELTLILRRDTTQRIDLEPAEGRSTLLKLQATNTVLAQKIQDFLRGYGAIK